MAPAPSCRLAAHTKPLALYSGIVTVGADGTAEVSFDIPNSPAPPG